MAISIRKLLLLILLVCLQTQAVANVMLSCAHSGAEAEVVTQGGCHQPSEAMAKTSDAESSEFTWIDCQRCHLGCICGGLAFLMPEALGIGPVPETAQLHIFQRHFYSFIPDFPYRPPISVLA